MTAKEFRESGLLEYYVLGVLSDQEVAKVEGYLIQYPELQSDYLEIQRSIQEYAKAQSIQPRADLEDSILKSVRELGDKSPVKSPKVSPESSKLINNNSGNALGLFKNLLLLTFGLATLFFAWKYSQKGNEYSNLQSEYIALETSCDSLNEIQLEKIETFEKLNNINNRSINITPTGGYLETNLLFHFNEVDKQNFIQIKRMPAIASNQAYQLWSLKDGEDPIPLTVFKDSGDIIIPVDFEEGTGTYAITIEAEGGATVPTLSRLIGTISVA